MAGWEYKLEPLGPDVGTLADVLSDEGAQGWELVTVVQLEDDSARRLIFRRELTNPTWGEAGAIPEPSPADGGPPSPP